MPSMAERLFGSLSRTSLNSATAWLPRAMFSADGAPGMYRLAYAVARYSRAFSSSGSASFACLKSSIAASDWPFLKAVTPLFKRSRALSLLQPETPRHDEQHRGECRNPAHAIRNRSVSHRSIPSLLWRDPTPVVARIHVRPAKGNLHQLSGLSPIPASTDRQKICLPRRISSITLATAWNSTAVSPLTNAVRSARGSKILCKRPRSPAMTPAAG